MAIKPQRLDMRYRIAWQGRWHVGSGYQSAGIERLQRRLHGPHGTPFVPGSQLKGVLRHQCERFALALELDALDPHVHSEEHSRRLVKHFTPLAKSELVVDRLFGTRYQGECLFVTNALPFAPKVENATFVHARTAIDRLTGTVKEQNLFTTELTEKDVHLHGTIRARHPAGVLTQENEGFPYEYTLLVAALLSLDTLGGDKSVGLGQCRMELVDDMVCWNGSALRHEDALESFRSEPEDWGELLNLLRQEGGST